MNINFKLFIILIYILLLSSCAEKISYSGKIFKIDKDFNSFNNKSDVVDHLGEPNFIDPIEKKYIYFSEKKKTKNFFSNEILESKLIVFEFNENNKIKSFYEYNLDNQKKIKFVKDQTTTKIIETGLLEKIFGGVGTSTTPDLE